MECLYCVKKITWANHFTTSFGYGIHSDKNGKIALYGTETRDYTNFITDSGVVKVKAMKSGK
ncbi:MAG: DUF6157 family protein [Porphyromonadaceae bacterium]|nr:DUF6157 family protein [Porphyromonadaceae bacterium]